MDLSAYINFSAVLDKSTVSPEIRLTDTGTYPGGVPPTITGYFSIQQPDGTIVATGSFSSPSTYWDSGALTITTTALRLRGDGNFQQGGYLITYYIRATGYDDTTLTKTFQLSYTRVLGVITNNFNIFTPSLIVEDGTNYDQNDMTLVSVARAWEATIHSVSGTDQDISGSDDTFDLNYLGDYYDASFAISLLANPQYTLDTPDDWVTLIDAVEATATLQSQVPQTIPQLDALLQALKDRADAESNCNTCKSRERYSYATALYTTFRRQGCDGNFAGLTKTYFQLIKVLNNNVTPSYTHTNDPISAYDFMCGDFTTTVPWSAITGKPSTVEISWVVGDVGFPGNGATDMTDARFINAATAQIVFFRNGQPQFPYNPGNGNTYYTKVSTASNTISFVTALNTGEELMVKIVAL